MDTRILLLLFLFHNVLNGDDSLYEVGDPIIQLNVDTFDDTLARKPHGWVVEYYATWCGHCQRFAPIYKQFAEDIEGWSGVMKVASIACSEPKNLLVCKSQHIRGFPTVKFYPPNMQKVARGIKLNGLRFYVGSIRASTLRYVENYVLKSPGQYPNLERFTSQQELVNKAIDSGTSHLFAIVEDEDDVSLNSDLAKSIILDMSSDYPRIMVGRLPRSAILNQEILWQPLPSMVSIDLQDNLVRFMTQLSARKDVKRLINTLSTGSWRPHTGSSVNTEPSTQPVPETEPVHSQPEYVKPTSLDIPLAIPLTTPAPLPLPEVGTTQREASLYIPAESMKSRDIDSNIYYMLWNEIASKNKIRGNTLIALKQYLSVLAKYHPSDGRIRNFLETVSNWIQHIGGTLDGTLYLNTIEGLQTDESFVIKNISWSSCDGSQTRYRGYPCSLWMTFHALTVAAYENYLLNPDELFDPMEVLGAIRSYVRHFLGCRNCAKHFHKMARHMERDVTLPEDVIIWLWKAHNKVNNRLAGDNTEDPDQPKIQFPSPTVCPTCRHGDEPHDMTNNETLWNIPEVVKYLRGFYNREIILGKSHSAVNGLQTLPPTALVRHTGPDTDIHGARVDQQHSHQQTAPARNSGNIPHQEPGESHDDGLSGDNVRHQNQQNEQESYRQQAGENPEYHRRQNQESQREQANQEKERDDATFQSGYGQDKTSGDGIRRNEETLGVDSNRRVVPGRQVEDERTQHGQRQPDNRLQAETRPYHTDRYNIDNVAGYRQDEVPYRQVTDYRKPNNIPRGGEENKYVPTDHTQSTQHRGHLPGGGTQLHISLRPSQPTYTGYGDTRDIPINHDDRNYNVPNQPNHNVQDQNSRYGHEYTSQTHHVPGYNKEPDHNVRDRNPYSGNNNYPNPAHTHWGSQTSPYDQAPHRRYSPSYQLPTASQPELPVSHNNLVPSHNAMRTIPASRPSVAPPSNSSCASRMTPWSPCSVTCDSGVSTRLVNQNEACEMRMEMRICQIRPCSFNIANYRMDATPGKCTANMRTASYLPLTFQGCTTVKGYRWRFCNRCHGYCCQPANDGTFSADVTCSHGNEVTSGTAQISWIVSCSCRRGSC